MPGRGVGEGGNGNSTVGIAKTQEVGMRWFLEERGEEIEIRRFDRGRRGICVNSKEGKTETGRRVKKVASWSE